MMEKYRPHAVVRTDRADGTILLRSAYGMSTPARRTTDWLDRWAAEAGDRTYLAERSGPGWRRVSYGEAREQVDALAAGLVARGMGPDTPILILSGNSVNHGLLVLAAQKVGIPTVPVAEQYALIPEARTRLTEAAALVRPRMVYAEDGVRFGDALALPAFDGLDKVVTTGEAPLRFDDLLQGGADIAAAAAAVGPDTVAKILLTSGSTSSPKGVLTTQAMLTANQAQISDAMPFLSQRPPVLVDWLPWNHVFGGSHNFNLVLANGGTLYIDAGKPVRPLVETTIENARLQSATIAFNVPIGFAMLRDAMKDDAALRETYFRDLDMLFYAGASLPQEVWADLEAMARDVRGDMPLFTSSWGLTETAPAALSQHEPTQRSGIVGVPVTGCEVKLIPDDDMRCEVRVRGPNIFSEYLRDPERTAEAFDEEGFFKTGDAMKFVDPDDMNMGLKFDGRLSEDFKLTTGIWVRAATLRLQMMDALKGYAQDIVVCGEGRDQIGLLIFPTPALAEGAEADAGALIGADLAGCLQRFLAGHEAEGSSTHVRRALVLADPPSMGAGEITPKGNLNAPKVLTARAGLLARLYDDNDKATVILP